jgi:hypothetical protein
VQEIDTGSAPVESHYINLLTCSNTYNLHKDGLPACPNRLFPWSRRNYYCFHGVVATTTNRGLSNRLPQRAHTDGDHTVLISNCRLVFEHCGVTKRFRLVASNEHDLDARDCREQERDSVFFYVTAKTVFEPKDMRSLSGEHLGGRTTLRSSASSNSSITSQMNWADNNTLNRALVAAQEFLRPPQQVT